MPFFQTKIFVTNCYSPIRPTSRLLFTREFRCFFRKGYRERKWVYMCYLRDGLCFGIWGSNSVVYHGSYVSQNRR